MTRERNRRRGTAKETRPRTRGNGKAPKSAYAPSPWYRRAIVSTSPAPRTRIPSADFWAAYENRTGALLLAVSKEDGKVIAEYRLDSEPVYNGIAVAAGRLYIATRDGEITCWGAK